MNLPTLHVGQSNPARDAACDEAMRNHVSAREAAGAVGLSVSAFREALGRHRSAREFDLFLEGTDGTRVRVCHVRTTKPFVQAALAAYRAYPGTLQRLEVPGWRITDGNAISVSIADIQQAMRPVSRKGTDSEVADATARRKAARDRIGLEA